MEEKPKDFLDYFVTSKEKKSTAYYDQILPYTEHLNIEVADEPSYVEVFVTVLPSSMLGEVQVLVSIPSWKYSFISPISIENKYVMEKLNEAQEGVSDWVPPLSNGIVDGIKKAYKNIIMFVIKS